MERVKKFREALQDAGKPYAQTANFLIIDGNQISMWVNKYVSAIASVPEFIGKPIPSSAFTWDELSGYERFYKYDYIMSPSRKNAIEFLQKKFLGNKRYFRIVGLSGLGKTRLALEAFRPTPDNPSILTFKNKFIYIDANRCNDIVSHIIAWRQQKLSGIIIIDNCPVGLYDMLIHEISFLGCNLKILTLNYAPSSMTSNTIRLERDSDAVVRGILTNHYPWLANSDLERVVQFAQGFPQLAVMMCDAHFKQGEHLAQLKDSELTKRLI